MSGQEKVRPTEEALLATVEKAFSGDFDPTWVINALPIGLALLDPCDGGYRVRLANPVFCKTFHVEPEALIDEVIERGPGYTEFSRILDHCETVSRSGKPSYFEWQSQEVPADRCYACHLLPRIDDNGNVGQILTVIFDRSNEKRAERILLHTALHDTLTNLPNRVLFLEKIEVALEKQEEAGTGHSAVLIINVDRFQLINETLGHVGGDEFLITLASKLNKLLRPEDSLARLSGDEFAILVPDITRIEDAMVVAERVHRLTRTPFQLAKTEFFSTVSIGIATTVNSQTYPEDLIRDADFALHRAKLSGRGETEIFHRDKHRHARSQLQLEVDLRRALENHELELYYQPIVDLSDLSLTGFEALARWKHPDHGMIPPSDFIPVAEETGVIVDLGRWALHTACQQLRTWRNIEPGAAELAISVNVSSVQIARADIAAEAEMVLSLSNLKGSDLRLEITESAIMKDPESAQKVLLRLKELDILLAIDDFGTGYSSLSYLQRFPIDIVKIDRAFVMDIESNSSNHRIVEIIGLLGNALGMTVVAEGIEKREHTKILKDLGCQYGQGYFFAKPVPAVEAQKLIALGDKWLD